MDLARQALDACSGYKRDLYLRAIERYRDQQLTRALALLERQGSPLRNVRSLVRFFETRAADPASGGGLLANALVEMCPHDPAVAKLLHETLERLRQGLERSLRSARASGELAPRRSPEQLSRVLAHAVIGLGVTGYAGTLSLLD